LVDYVRDPTEADVWDSWDGVRGLIRKGAKEHFGEGTEKFLKAAERKENWMRGEILRRYGLSHDEIMLDEEIAK
jgi:hypothetical protein